MKTYLQNRVKRLDYLICAFFSLLVFVPYMNAQDVTLTTQSEIDNFNYTQVRSLTIREKTPGEITNLSGLSVLQRVTYKLEIADNSSLKSLDGLNNLSEVYGQAEVILYTEGDLIISNNSSLENIDALLNLKIVGLYLSITGNRSLKNIDGLRNVTRWLGYETSGGIWIEDNSSLTNLDGLASVLVIEGGCVIRNNPLLTSFCGLYLHFMYGYWSFWEVSANGANPSREDIISSGPCPPGMFKGDIKLEAQWQVDAFNYYEVEGNIEIKEPLPGLISNLDGLSELRDVKGHLTISDNSAITNLDGLKNLRRVGISYPDPWGGYAYGKLLIFNNDALDNIDGLSNLVFVPTSLVIKDNDALKNIKGISGLDRVAYDREGMASGTMGGYLGIENNSKLKTLDGFNMWFLGSLTIRNNSSLEDISSLSRLSYLGDMIRFGGPAIGSLDIINNPLVYEFCSLHKLFTIDYGFNQGPVNISENGNNPTKEEIILAGPCAPKIILNVMNGSFNGDARLGTMTGSINSRAVYFQGLNGGVTFNVDIPQSSKNWYAWGRMYYMSSCEKNSFNLRFDNNKYVLGDNDNKYNQWHWDGNDGARINLGILSPGQHKLIVSGREPGLTLWIDQIILTADPDYVPAGFTPGTSILTLNAMSGKFTGDARLGTMTGSVNPRTVYFQGLNGGVSFNVNIPSSKRPWRAWARMYYMSSGGKNSFYVTVAGKKYILGDNDSKYNQWHWDASNGAMIDLGALRPGEHTIMISGREPGLTLWVDQLILTDDPDYMPEGFSYSTTKIVLNAMNGTLTGNARLGCMTGALNTRCVYFQDEIDGGINVGVSFNVDIPASKRNWYIWGRMYYMSSGGKNSFYVSINGGIYVLGDNDSKYNQWHWDGNNGAKIDLGILAARNYFIRISGREPGLTLWIDQIILTDDPDFNPAEVLVKEAAEAETIETGQQKIAPSEYQLSQNYPNPFNPITTIKYSLPEAAFVKLQVYNSLGELVKTMVSETKNAGYYEISFDASSLSSGMYIYKIEAGRFVQSCKMILLK